MAESQKTIEEVKNPETFDLGAFIQGKVKYPKRDTTVVLDRDTIFTAREIADEIADTEADKREEASLSIAPDPSYDEKLAELKAKLEAVMEEAKASSLTFTMKGVAPKVWRVADKALRQKFKVDKTATEDEKLENDIAFRAAINIEIVWATTQQIGDPEGNVVVKPSKEHIAQLADNLDEHEWVKLVDLANQLTFEISNLDDAISNDSDFLATS